MNTVNPLKIRLRQPVLINSSQPNGYLTNPKNPNILLQKIYVNQLAHNETVDYSIIRGEVSDNLYHIIDQQLMNYAQDNHHKLIGMLCYLDCNYNLGKKDQIAQIINLPAPAQRLAFTTISRQVAQAIKIGNAPLDNALAGQALANVVQRNIIYNYTTGYHDAQLILRSTLPTKAAPLAIYDAAPNYTGRMHPVKPALFHCATPIVIPYADFMLLQAIEKGYASLLPQDFANQYLPYTKYNQWRHSRSQQAYFSSSLSWQNVVSITNRDEIAQSHGYRDFKQLYEQTLKS